MFDTPPKYTVPVYTHLLSVWVLQSGVSYLIKLLTEEMDIWMENELGKSVEIVLHNPVDHSSFVKRVQQILVTF